MANNGMLESVKMDYRNGQVRVCLMGAPFDTNNRGVSALASSLVTLVKGTLPKAIISFFMGHPKKIKKIVDFAGERVLIDVINYRLSPKAILQEHIICLLLLALLIRVSPSSRFREKIIHLNARLTDLNNCNFIGAINGGDSFSDIYGLGRFIEGILPMIIIILLGKRLILLPQTYGPYNSWLAKTIARWVILHSSMVLARDQESLPLINNLLRNYTKKVPIGFCPDVAFTLPSVFPAKFTICPSVDAFGEETWVGININGLMFNGGYKGANMFGLCFEYKAFILSLIEKLMNEAPPIRVILIPHTYGQRGNVNSDPEASMQVYEVLNDKYRDRLYLLTGEYREFEIKGIIGRCDFFIGSRMHACIAAISQGVPTAAVAYSKKFYGVFESVGLETMVVDARSLDLDEAVHRIIDLFKNRELEAEFSKHKIDSTKEQVKETFTRLFSNPDPGNKASPLPHG